MQVEWGFREQVWEFLVCWQIFDAAGNLTTVTSPDENIAANVVILFGFELSQRSCGALPDLVIQRLKQAVKTRCAQSVLAGASPPGDDSRLARILIDWSTLTVLYFLWLCLRVSFFVKKCHVWYTLCLCSASLNFFLSVVRLPTISDAVEKCIMFFVARVWVVIYC